MFRVRRLLFLSLPPLLRCASLERGALKDEKDIVAEEEGERGGGKKREGEEDPGRAIGPRGSIRYVNGNIIQIRRLADPSSPRMRINNFMNLLLYEATDNQRAVPYAHSLAAAPLAQPSSLLFSLRGFSAARSLLFFKPRQKTRLRLYGSRFSRARFLHALPF